MNQPSCSNYRKNNLSTVLPVAALILMLSVITVLIWQDSKNHYADYLANQQALMQSETQGGAAQLTVFLQELKRAVRLFARAQPDLLNSMLVDTENDAFREKLDELLRNHFSEAFTWTIANTAGKPLLVDIESLIGEVCAKDIQAFAINKKQSEVYIHPHGVLYHFDIMVNWEDDKNETNIFFASFDAQILADILAHRQLPGHRLYLINNEISDLIEVGAKGPRNKLGRPIKLSTSEKNAIMASTPVTGTRWTLVALPETNLLLHTRTEILRKAWILISGCALITILLIMVILRSSRREKKLHTQLTQDPVTKLPNSYALLEYIQRLLHTKRLMKMQVSSFTLLLLELDALKRMGDGFFSYHDDSELTLQAANAIKSVFPPDTFLARLSGKQFAVLLANQPDQDITSYINDIKQKIIGALNNKGGVMLTYLPAGWVVYPTDATDMETLLKKVNSTLYADHP